IQITPGTLPHAKVMHAIELLGAQVAPMERSCGYRGKCCVVRSRKQGQAFKSSARGAVRISNAQAASNRAMTSVANSSEQARQSEDVRLVVDTIPTLAWSARSDGSADFFNQRWLDYTGLSAEQALDWGWTV